MLLANATHILIIVWADVGSADVAPNVPTVNLTQFSSLGVKFNTWITQPIGSHTMYSVIFGEYSIRNGNTRGFSWYSDGVPNPDVRLSTLALPDAAKTAGYSVALHGKWGLGGNCLGDAEEFRNTTPFLHGFSTWNAGIGSNVSGGVGTGYRDWERIDNGVESISKQWADEAIKDEWVSWWLSTPGPRFSVVWFSGAHGPFNRGAPQGILPPNYIPTSTPRGRYESIIVALDLLTGEMLSYVDFDETLVFLFTTCGTPDRASLTSTPKRVKRSTFDPGIRTPAAVRGKGVAVGKTAELVSPVDIWATLADMTEIAPPPVRSDSVSFARILDDPTSKSSRRYTYSQHVEEAVRTRTYKLRDDGFGTLELYDLLADPAELQPIDPATYFNNELVHNMRRWLANPGSGMIMDARERDSRPPVHDPRRLPAAR